MSPTLQAGHRNRSQEIDGSPSKEMIADDDGDDDGFW